MKRSDQRLVMMAAWLALKVGKSLIKSTIGQKPAGKAAFRALDRLRRWLPGQAGSLASFDYVDAKGTKSQRLVRGWRTKGGIVQGFCVMRGAVRSFRNDRIKGWNELE